jgi:hypothetical protein
LHYYILILVSVFILLPNKCLTVDVYVS